MSEHELAWGITGISLMSLITVFAFKAPAWVFLIGIGFIGIIASGGDLETPYEQLLRRREAEQQELMEKRESESLLVAEQLAEPDAVAKSYQKSRVLEADQERRELLRDLVTIGRKESDFDMMTYNEILASLTPRDVDNLQDLRSFLR